MYLPFSPAVLLLRITGHSTSHRMVADTYAWFSKSTQRQLRYKELYDVINVGEEPLKILKLSDTRWLSIAICLERIVDQFDELKLHFGLVMDEDCRYKAKLHDM